MTSPASVHNLVRANNAVWSAMYYDEVVDTDDYQFTYMSGADAGYYNCAQAVSRAGPDFLSTLETFYAARGVYPAVYLDPETDPCLLPQLVAAGYVEVPEENENCHVLDLVESVSKTRLPEAWLHIAPDRVQAVRLSDPDAPLFASFLDIDALTNMLPDVVRHKLEQNLRHRRRPDVDVQCFLAMVDGRPVSSRVVGLFDEYALFAEGGTLEPYRRLGLYSFLLEHGLAFARARGARIAYQTAASSAFSNPAVLRIGFRRVCTRVYMQRRPRVSDTVA